MRVHSIVRMYETVAIEIDSHRSPPPHHYPFLLRSTIIRFATKCKIVNDSKLLRFTLVSKITYTHANNWCFKSFCDRTDVASSSFH